MAPTKAHTSAKGRRCRKIVTFKQTPSNVSSHAEYGGAPTYP